MSSKNGNSSFNLVESDINEHDSSLLSISEEDREEKDIESDLEVEIAKEHSNPNSSFKEENGASAKPRFAISHKLSKFFSKNRK
jgi:hypothetical protein